MFGKDFRQIQQIKVQYKIQIVDKQRPRTVIRKMSRRLKGL